jgi:hypothetical protein
MFYYLESWMSLQEGWCAVKVCIDINPNELKVITNSVNFSKYALRAMSCQRPVE